jgi:hypothetical protein
VAKMAKRNSLVLQKPEVPVDRVAMAKAAGLLGVAIPVGEHADAELLGALRMKIQRLLKDIPKDDHLVCTQCDEFSTEATPFCPFCGDDGTSDVEVSAVMPAMTREPDDETEDDAEDIEFDEPETVVEPEAVPAAAAEVVEKKQPKKKAEKPAAIVKPEPVKPLAQDLSEDMKALKVELDEIVAKIVEYTSVTIGATYDMGLLLKQIHDRTMYRAYGFDNFKKFVENSLPLSRQTVHQLVALVEQFDRKAFEEFGYRKLKAISGLVGESRSEVLAAARNATAAEVDAMVANVKRKARPALSAVGDAEATPTSSRAKQPAPVSNGKVTLLAKLDSKPLEVKLISAKSGKPVTSAGRISYQVADAYGDIELAEGVHMRIALRITGKDISGFTVQYVRAAEAAE